MLQLIREKIISFSKDETGAVALEFAVHFFPVTIAMIGIFETIWILMVQNDMGRAAAETARYMRLGIAVNAAGVSWDETELRTRFCNNLWIVSCDNPLHPRHPMAFEVRVLDTLGEAASQPISDILQTVTDTDSDHNSYTYMTMNSLIDPDAYGKPALWDEDTESMTESSVVLFRVYMAFPALARLWDPAIAHTRDGRSILSVTQIFTTEPYK